MFISKKLTIAALGLLLPLQMMVPAQAKQSSGTALLATLGFGGIAFLSWHIPRIVESEEKEKLLFNTKKKYDALAKLSASSQTGYQFHMPTSKNSVNTKNEASYQYGSPSSFPWKTATLGTIILGLLL